MSKKKMTLVVLGTFLILSGLSGLISGLGTLGFVTAILAVSAGVMILVYTPGISYRIGWMVAAIYLIAVGLIRILSIDFASRGILMALLAGVAGILLIIRMSKIKGNIGYLLFFIWLIMLGLMGLVSLGWLGAALNIITLAAGILLILEM